MKSELLNLLYNRIKELGYGDLTLDIYFVNIPMPLVNQLLSLNDRDLIVYLKIINLLIEKDLLEKNESKMYSISSTFLINLREEKVKTLVGLLINTDIIFNKNFLLVSNMLLQNWHPSKLELIDDVFMSFNSLRNINIIDIMENIKRIKNPSQLNAYKSLVLNRRFRGTKNFTKIKNLILNNPSNPNLEFVSEACESNTLIKASRSENIVLNNSVITFITEYLMLAKDLEEADLIFDIITDESIFNSYPLAIKLLNTIVNPKNKMYLPYVAKLVENKEILSNQVFDNILNSLFKANTALQIEAIMSILEFPNLLKNDISQVSMILEKYLKISYKYQLVSLNTILNKITKEENFDLYSDKYFSIIDSIVPNKKEKDKEDIKDYQALCLANTFEYIIKSNDCNSILNTILKENQMNCKYIQLLLEIPNITELSDFIQVFDRLRITNDENKKKNIIALLTQEKVIKSSNYLNLIDIINKSNKHQGNKILEIINKVNNIETYELIKLLEVLLIEIDNKKVDLIAELISVYEFVGFEKTLSDIKLITECNELKDIKDTVKDIKNEIKTIEIMNKEKEGLNFIEKMKLKKLTRKVEEE